MNDMEPIDKIDDKKSIELKRTEDNNQDMDPESSTDIDTEYDVPPERNVTLLMYAPPKLFKRNRD